MRLIGTTVLVMAAVTLAAIPEASTAAAQEPVLACIVMNAERLPPATRTSPLDSLSFEVAGSPVKICYGRPSARGREIFGALVVYDELWRTGANEPTMIHTSIALDIAGITVQPGTYALYTVPGESEWQLIVNASTTQWGRESRYTEEVAAGELGRATVASGATGDYVEMFTIRSEAADGGADVFLEWENTRALIPIGAVN